MDYLLSSGFWSVVRSRRICFKKRSWRHDSQYDNAGLLLPKKKLIKVYSAVQSRCLGGSFFYTFLLIIGNFTIFVTI